MAGLSGIAIVAATALIGTVPAVGAPVHPAAIGGGIVQPVTQFEAGRYIVTLADSAAASYEGGVSGLRATAPGEGEQLETGDAAVRAYSAYLGEKQEEVAASVDAEIGYSYTLASNAFTAELTTEQLVGLAANRDVVALTPDEIVPLAAVPSTDFLGLAGDDGVWAAIGGAERAGEGVVVGVLDTGIAPENPSFAGEPLGTEAGSEPYLDGETIVFGKADGGTFTGACVDGEQFGPGDCSTKVIGARYYVDGFGADRLGDASIGEYVSPRDGDGHGSHTASTAAGNHEVPASVSGVGYGAVSGVAPGAKIAAYKVCWSGPDPSVTTDDGCATSDLLAGIEAAVDDGVDVINYSIGGGAATTTVSLTDQAFLNAAAAGIFVSAAAGNAGPGSSTLDNAAPWITTVAATTIPSYEATATLGDGTAVAGASISVDRTEGAEPLSGALVRADLVAVAGHDPADALLCGPGSLDPDLVAGSVVFCERGVYDRVAKSAEVLRAGGAGLLLVNRTPGSIDTDDHSVPTVHLADRHWETVYGAAGEEGASVTFTPGNTTDYTPPTPQVAGFSSRGPVLADGSDILKPDIGAPGVAILAAGANAAGADPGFAFLSGTSMAAPHIAGLAALYLGERPNASPAEIKSALMTTAYDTVDGEGGTVTDPFAQGAGHADPTRFFEPGLLYLNGVDDWLSYIQGIGYDIGVDPVDPSDLNLASIAIGALTAPERITRTVTATQAGTFEARVNGLAGIEAVVEPAMLSFGAAGESLSFTVTFARTDAPLDVFTTGSLDWVSGDTVVHSPIAVRPVTLVAPGSVSGTGLDGSVAVEITPGGTGEIPLSASGLATGQLHPDPDDPESEHSGAGSGGEWFEYRVAVPEGTELARFDLDAVDDTSDLDLTVYLLNAEGTPVAGWQSASASADERVDLPNPVAGDYLVYVDVFSGTTAFDFTTFAVAGAGAGDFAVDPAVVSGEQGVPVGFTASWSGLAPDTAYLGLVHYADSGLMTVVEVASGEAPDPDAPVNTVPPAISGTPMVGAELTAGPGEWDQDGLAFGYQWQRDGEDVPGATAAAYTVGPADQGARLSVVVTASKEGTPSASASSEPVLVLFQASATISLSTPVSLSFIPVRATVTVTSDGELAGESVTVTVGGSSATAVLDGAGRATVTLPKVGAGIYSVKASFAGTDAVQAATSRGALLVILF